MKKNYIAAEGTPGRTIIARLKPGQDIVVGITQILTDKNIKAGYMPVIAGGFKQLRLISMKPGESADSPVQIERDYTEPMEYFGVGTIAQHNGQPSLHVHLSAGRTENKSLTGHLVSGEIVLVTEVVIVEINGVNLIRREDPEIFNLPLLDIADER